MLFCLLINLVNILSAFLITCKVFKPAKLVDSLITLFIVYLSLIISSELFLGILGKLYFLNLLFLNLLILSAVIFLTKKSGFVFPRANLGGLSLSVVKNNPALFLLAAILGFGLVKFWINLLNPPFGWDSLNYHFTFAVEWIKNGNLSCPITVSDDPSPSYYPINGSLFYLWWMLPLKSVYLADLGQFPFFLLAALTVFSISRKLGLGNKYAFYAACIFSLVPNYFKQLEVAYVDIMVGALLLACVNFLLNLRGRFEIKDTLLFSLALGLLIGTKTVALAYSLLLLIPFLIVCLSVKRYSTIFSSLAIILALGGYSFVRNILLTANPLYPLNLLVFGQSLLKGPINSSVYKAHFVYSDYSLLKLLFHEGMGAGTFLLALPATILAFPAWLAKERKPRFFLTGYILLLPLLLYSVYRWLIPLPNSRYIYGLLGLALAAAFYLMVKILRLKDPVITALVVICALTSLPEISRRKELIIALVLTAVIFAILKRLLAPRPRVVLSLFFVVIAIAVVVNQKAYLAYEYKGYIRTRGYSGFWEDATIAWDWLNTRTQADNIAYTGRPVPFPLYGSGFKNNVYYVSVNSVDPAQLHYFKNSSYSWGYDFLSLHQNLQLANNYRGQADYSFWLANLKRRKTGYLFVYSLHQTEKIIFPLEDNWAMENPSVFQPLWQSAGIHIYKVK